MNPRLSDKLSKLADTLNTAKNAEEAAAAVVDVERLVLKSNYDDHKTEGAEGYESREYLVGEANTRGLSWKLNLLRTVAAATFCRMVRLGVHGGNVVILGQPENIDTTLQIYASLIPVYEKLSLSAHAEFAEGRTPEEGAPTINRIGWINQWLVAAPSDLEAALAESRAKDTASNGKIATMAAEAETALKEFQTSLAPTVIAKTPKAPRAPKAPKEKKPRKSSRDPQADASPDESISANGDSENTGDDESDDAYPGVTYAWDGSGPSDAGTAEGDTAEEARAEAAS